MIVYGDVPREAEPQALLRTLEVALRHVAVLPPGIRRHGALAAAFIQAGELAQGLADAGFAARGDLDAPSALDDAAMALVMQLAATLRCSWRSGFRDMPPLPEVKLPDALPERVRPKRAEGFSFYALYPEAFLAAAEASGLGPETRVIGLRSIGLPLAALVATALGTSPPVTLRPVGHPFRRQLALSPAMAARLRGRGACAVVDEGPGLSGSSMGAVADWLEQHGTPPGQVHFFPSHGGVPGREASPRHRARWEKAPRHLRDFDALVLHAPRPAHRLEQWVEDLTGPAEVPPREISGGAWRGLWGEQEGAWPPANPQGERRKFLLHAGGGDWLLKFNGLGEEGARKATMGQALSEAGLVPAIAGERHGFLVQRWRGEATRLDQAPLPASALLPAVARYLGFRARHFAAGAEGATLATLWDMACHNTAEALGEEAARALRRTQPDLARAERGLRRIRGDNRLAAWEWLALPDGRLLKADALDHHAAHDLIGCQDLAWDLVGAAVELGLDPEWLSGAAAAVSGRETDPALLRAYAAPYFAFHLGAATMAAAANGGMPGDAARLREEAGRYAGALHHLISAGGLLARGGIPGGSMAHLWQATAPALPRAAHGALASPGPDAVG